MVLGQACAKRPNIGRGADQMPEMGPRIAKRRRQGQIREIGGNGDADLGVRCCHAAFGGGDIGPPLQQGRRHADGRHRHIGRQAGRRDREIAGRLADQDGNGMFQCRALHAGIDGGCLGVQQLRAGRQHVGLRRHTDIILVLGDLQRAGIFLSRAIEQPLEFFLITKLEIIDRQRALRRQPRGSEIGGAGLGRRDNRLRPCGGCGPRHRYPSLC